VLPHGATIVPVDVHTGKPLDLSVIDRRTGKPVAAGAVGFAAGPAASQRVKRTLTPPLVLGAQPRTTDPATPSLAEGANERGEHTG